jgi:uncharacterized protein YndB with AHSA1/START domain
MALEHLQASAAMLIRAPAAEVYEALVNPDITTQFWFTHSSGRLEPGATVQWRWAMFGAEATVRVLAYEPPRRLLVDWGTAETPSPVEWTLTDRGDGTTFLQVTNSGFQGDAEAIANAALGSTQGFTIVLANLKAWLEHGLRLNLVADRFPDGLGQG